VSFFLGGQITAKAPTSNQRLFKKKVAQTAQQLMRDGRSFAKSQHNLHRRKFPAFDARQDLIRNNFSS
jgi:hypothetical protein